MTRKLFSLIISGVVCFSTPLLAASTPPPLLSPSSPYIASPHFNFTPNHALTNNPFHILINKTNPLPQGFVPDALVVPDVRFSFSGTHEKSYLNPTAASALETLFEDATKEGLSLAAVSGYRSYSRQKVLYESYVARDGQAKADMYSARPGTSEHQSGLAIDVSTGSVGYALTEAFGDTPEGIWLAHHAHHYGFIIRYPKNKHSLTGYMYEPWHLRYVGSELAHFLYEENLILEEAIDRHAEWWFNFNPSTAYYPLL